MRLRLACLSIAALTTATGALAELRGTRTPPEFTPGEIELITRDKRLAGAATRCAWEIRHALDMLSAGDTNTRSGTAGTVQCPSESGSQRATDEGALDILKILKDVSEQGSSRTVDGPVADKNEGTPAFSVDELVLIQKDKSGRLTHALTHCSWQLRHAFDTLLHGARDWAHERMCVLPQSGEKPAGRNAEGALDILIILREASGDSTQR